MPPKFLSELYRNKTDWKLKFKVYVEFNGFFQLFTLLDPATRQKAKKARIFKILANEKARLKSTLKTPFKNAENAVECIKKHFGDDYRIEEFELKAGEKYPENYEQCRSDIWIIIHPQKKRRCLIIRNNQNESISFPNKAIVVCIRTGSYYCLNAETKVSCTLVSKM